MQGQFLVVADEVVELPLIGEEDDELAPDVFGEPDTVAQKQAFKLRRIDIGIEPPHLCERRGFQTRGSAVLILQPIEGNVELQLPDSAE